MVKVGFACPTVGKTLLPATKRFSNPWTRQFSSTTPLCGEADIRVVPDGCFISSNDVDETDDSSTSLQNVGIPALARIVPKS